MNNDILCSILNFNFSHFVILSCSDLCNNNSDSYFAVRKAIPIKKKKTKKTIQQISNIIFWYIIIIFNKISLYAYHTRAVYSKSNLHRKRTNINTLINFPATASVNYRFVRVSRSIEASGIRLVIAAVIIHQYTHIHTHTFHTII